MRTDLVLTILAKELRETLRDRRTLLSSIITGPILVPFFFSGAMALSLNQNVVKLDEAIKVTVVGERNAPNLVQFLRENGLAVTLRDGDAAQARRWTVQGDELAVLVVPPEFGGKFTAGQPARVLLFADGADNEADKRADRTRRVLIPQHVSIEAFAEMTMGSSSKGQKSDRFSFQALTGPPRLGKRPFDCFQPKAPYFFR